MTNRAELRTALRRRLEDESGTPLWADDVLDDALAAALREYGTRLPREQTAMVAIDAGLTGISVTDAPLAGLPPGRIARVFDDDGELVPRWPGGHGGTGQSWRWWDATLLLETALSEPATWRIEFLGDRALPADDITDVPIATGDEEIVLLLALATALERRAVADGKRGNGMRAGIGISGNAARARSRADWLLDRRRRHARGGRLG